MTKPVILVIAMVVALCAVSVAHAQQATVPNVVGMPVNQAVKALNGTGLQGTTSSHLTTNKSQDGTVMKQDPAAGQKIVKGGAVALTVYKYLDPASLARTTNFAATVAVPDVRNLSVDDAMDRIRAAGLGFDGTQTETARPELNGKVYDQSPSPGTTVPTSGSRITVKAWVYKESALEARGDFIPEQKTYLLMVKGGMPPYDVVASYDVPKNVKTALGQKIVTITPLTDSPGAPGWKMYRITNLVPLEATMNITDAKGRKHQYKLHLTQANR